MSVRPVDIAERLEISRQAINGFINQGMPTDSIEAAEAWYNERQMRRNGGANVRKNAEITLTAGQMSENDRNFAHIVEQHRELKARAYQQYLEDLDEHSPNQSKSYATYDKLVKTLVSLERELHARNIAAKEYIKTQTAVERFGKVLLAIRNELTQLSTKIAIKANPDAPGTAMKAIDEEVTKILARLSNQADDAKDAVKEAVVEVTIEETQSTDPDEVQNDNGEAV
jgi:hypothetical protein